MTGRLKRQMSVEALTQAPRSVRRLRMRCLRKVGAPRRYEQEVLALKPQSVSVFTSG